MPAYSSSSSEQGEEGGSQRKRTRRVRSPAARLRHASRSGAGTGESSSAAAQHRAEAGATTSASSDGLLLRNANANARSSVQASTSAAAAAAGAPQKTSDTPAHVASLACQLRAPREHHNNALVRDLDVIRCKRRLQFGDLSRHYIPYARAVANIIAWPRQVTLKDVDEIPWVGPKIREKVLEFVQTGKIAEAREIRASDWFQTMELLTSIYGIGRTRADAFYEQGVRSLDDLEKLHQPDSKWSLDYYDDMQERMTRSDVESIRDYVQIQLDLIKPDGHIEICGSYRRGKPTVHDVDLIITFPHRAGAEVNVLELLLHRLDRKGLIAKRLYYSNVRSASGGRPKENIKMDSLDKAFIIFKHPRSKLRSRDKFRRVDLIVAPWQCFGAAVLGWTGSTQFERDIRRHAEHLGYKFESGGLTERLTGREITATCEEDIFRILKLDYIPPELRNADPSGN